MVVAFDTQCIYVGVQQCATQMPPILPRRRSEASAVMWSPDDQLKTTRKRAKQVSIAFRWVF
jgi:hypothetical protein